MIPNVSPTSNSTDIVLAWDYNAFQAWPVQATTQWTQRFVVGNPETGVFNNRIVTVPRGPTGEFFGDLFCAGHCWLPDGRLFVAGGNRKYNNQGATPNYLGSRFAAFWDPALAGSQANNWGWDFRLINGTYTPNRQMRYARWYPTVTLISRDLVMVSGGTDDTDDATRNPDVRRTYEIFDLTTGDWHRDPNSVPIPNAPRLHNGPIPSVEFGDYPRLHSLTTQSVFLSGAWPDSARSVHQRNVTPQAWLAPVQGVPGLTVVARDGGASVLVPNVGSIPAQQDQIMAIGGGAWYADESTAACGRVGRFDPRQRRQCCTPAGVAHDLATELRPDGGQCRPRAEWRHRVDGRVLAVLLGSSLGPMDWHCQTDRGVGPHQRLEA